MASMGLIGFNFAGTRQIARSTGIGLNFLTKLRIFMLLNPLDPRLKIV